ncbi:putative pentatricopeptide repeat-containing protein At1g17630 [Mercurialis annua]|uniref:putative pentatricopeptide repeat-containing protein At1g17630 n=1 Tax=Mercurialis annua TaxID=3986 RepID=UPI0021606D48|nr:putative pentatricopeptide repeat-containing protein At1g17630 [Mercurialis annua]
MLHAASSRNLLRPFPLRFTNISSILNQTHFRQYHNLSNRNEFPDVFDHLLQQCNTIQHCKQIHTHVITTGSHSSAFLAARIISVYARFGHLFDAHKVFNTTPSECRTNYLLCNSILRANVSNERYENVIKLYVRMREIGVLGDGFTFPLVIKACAHVGSFNLCRTVHGHVFEMGFQNSIHVGNELIGMYSKVGKIRDARNVFDRMSVRSYISWNIMISGYAFNYDCSGAFNIFGRMESEGFEPTHVSWTSLISSYARCGWYEEVTRLFDLMRVRGVEVSGETLAVVLSVCRDLGLFNWAKGIHGVVVKGGYEEYSFVKSALICVYGKHGDVNGARNLFLEMKNKSLASWNSLITSHAEAGLCDEALEIFSQLERSGDCLRLRPNVVSWSAVIDGFASGGRGEESLELFRRMQDAKILANAVTISTVLSVCAELAALIHGRELHGHAIRAVIDKNILVGNGLVNMYTKCGCIKEGHVIFERIEKKDLISWNTMITGYGMHGFGVNALEIFDQMTKLGFKPDGVTFVSILSACSHGGLVQEGRRLFDQMLNEYTIEPQIEHYACMVDLLGRAGLLREASEIVKNMPLKPNACVWGALLNSSRMHSNTEVAEETASYLFSVTEHETTGNYMLLSNIYAASGRWEDFARVRSSAKTKGLKKNPGQSWINVNKNVFMFSAGNSMQTGLNHIYEMLEELVLQMEGEGNSLIMNSLENM